MSEPTLEQRLARVERENRCLKRTGVTALAVIAALLLMGQATSTKRFTAFMAEEFILRDASGRVRGALSVVEGEPHLSLYDENEKLRFGIRAAADKVTLVLKGKDEKSGVLLTVADGTTKLSIDDKDGNERTEIGLRSDSTPILRLYDKGRKLRAGLGVDGDGSVNLLLADAEKGHAELTVQQGGLPALRFVDKDVNVRIGLSLTDLGPALRMTDKDEKVIWKAP